MAGAFLLPNEYWLSIQITPQDVENLHTFLFERETPLTIGDLSAEFVKARVKLERDSAEGKQKTAGKSFLPKEKYQIGEDLVFPALGWKRGRVVSLRTGENPSITNFDVLTVAMEDSSERLFAANLESHPLNEAPIPPSENAEMSSDLILREHRGLIEKKLEEAFAADEGLVKILAALTFHFKGKQKPIDMNFNAVKAGAEWAKANLEKNDPYQLESMSKTEGLIMADGNTAAAIGSIFGGVQFAGWYPITPASSLAESLIDYLPLLRTREDGKHTYAVVQAEDELAALGMAVGAGWSGLRAMTSTSGPGLSLMTEFAGLAYYAEIPVVIWDVQRIGPSTGLPTRTSQGDLTFAYFIGHGDSHSVILLPGDVSECFDFGWQSFDLAERIQTPVFVLSDLDMGMNQWMSKPFQYPEVPMDRGSYGKK